MLTCQSRIYVANLSLLTISMIYLSHDFAKGEAWVERMLESREHNLGAIEKSHFSPHRIPIRNIYKHDIETLRG